MATTWGRAWSWRSSSSSAAHEDGGGITGDVGRSPAGAGSGSSMASGTPTYTTTTGSRSSSSTCTPMSGSFVILQPSVVEEISGDDEEQERLKKKKLKHMEALVVRFASDRSAPESWLSQLKVAWVLDLAHVSESKKFMSGQLLHLARSWILALLEITKSISAYFGHAISEKEDTGPPASEFVRFFRATLSQMLPFVDAIVAVKRRRSRSSTYGWWGSVEPVDGKLQALILLHDALTTTVSQQETRDLLPAELLMAKVDAAIWDTMKDTQAGLMSSSSWGAIVPGSSDIHPITRSSISYIKVLWDNYGTANRILHDAFLRGEDPVPDNENASHLTNLTKQMIHSLEQMLTWNTYSSPIPGNKSLEFLFLVNNFHFIHQQKQLWPLAFPTQDLTAKIDFYVKSYIQVSWAPVLKCLHNPTAPRCLISSGNSQLPKFEACLQDTYNAQKHWKVPDPGMRKRMREAIIEELIPAFTEFFKDKTVSTPTISPQEMTTMLQELFEG